MSKLNLVLCILCILIFTQCQKSDSIQTEPSAGHSSLQLAKGGSGNNNTSAGNLNSVVPQDIRWKSGDSSYIFVSLLQPAPAGGAVLIITSSNASYVVPSFVVIPAGNYSVQIRVATTAVQNAISVSFSVQLGTQIKSNTVKLYPPVATLPRPIIVAPSNGKSFKFGLNILYDWSDNNNAWAGIMELSKSSSFPNNNSTVTFGNFDSFYTTNFTPGTGTLYWRVKFVDASNNPGPWSATRTIVVKPQ